MTDTCLQPSFSVKSPRALAVALASIGLAALILPACEGAPTRPGDATLDLISGGEQQTVAGGRFPEPVVVRVTDRRGNAVAGRTLTAGPESGGGWVVQERLDTDAEGLAAFDWYAGFRPEEVQRLVVRLEQLEVEVVGTTHEPQPGTSYFGYREWVEYIPGTLPIVIAAPHGGDLAPPDIPDRSGPGVVIATDLNTREIAYAVGDALEEGTGARPHLVVLHLRRTKLDANRDLAEAALGNPLAGLAWREFHAWIETAKAAIVDGPGSGMFVDLHGHGHALQVLELGYLLTSVDLARSDEELDAPWALQESSLRTLPERSGSTHADLVRGPTSLGALYEAEGYPSVPSPSRRHPAGHPYFWGGYNTERHGCRDGGTICGYQLELNREGIRDFEEDWTAFAEAHARVVEAFFEAHFGEGFPIDG